MKPIEFTKEMKILAMSFNKDFTEETLELWYSHFMNINITIFKKAIQDTIVSKKYIPTIAELLDMCKKEQVNMKLSIIDIMAHNGYFKTEKEYQKTIKWIEKDITPEWLLVDMQNQYKKELSNERVMIGG